MANYTARGGFWPVDEAAARFNPYEIASAYGTAVYPGDVMTLLTDGTVAACTAGGAPLIIGVVKSCSYVKDGVRVDAKYIPASTTYTPTARGSRNATIVEIFDDPATNFLAPAAAHANTATEALVRAALGANFDMVAGTADTVFGRSGHAIDGNPIAGTAQFRLVSLSRKAGNDLASAYWLGVYSINEGFHANFSAAGI